MYEAKRKGGGHALYDRSLDQNTPERLAMIADLDRAIRERQLCLHYQPKLDLHDGTHCGFEALVRWDHPRLGLLEPDSFLPLAELGETIHPLTDLVLDLALEQLRKWRDMSVPVLSLLVICILPCLHPMAWSSDRGRRSGHRHELPLPAHSVSGAVNPF